MAEKLTKTQIDEINELSKQGLLSDEFFGSDSSVTPQPGLNLVGRLTSRKFLLPFAYAALVILNKQLELNVTNDQLEQIFILVLTFMGVEGARDAIETYGSSVD